MGYKSGTSFEIVSKNLEPHPVQIFWLDSPANIDQTPDILTVTLKKANE